jgi:hypothetical protein
VNSENDIGGREGLMSENNEIPETLKAGQYIRRQFTWLPGQLAMVVRVAEELEMSQNAAARWLVDVGLRAYVNGQRPEIEAVEVQMGPKLQDWSEIK